MERSEDAGRPVKYSVFPVLPGRLLRAPVWRAHFLRLKSFSSSGKLQMGVQWVESHSDRVRSEFENKPESGAE